MITTDTKHTRRYLSNVLRALHGALAHEQHHVMDDRLTMKPTSVSGFNPFFNTEAVMDPIKPSKFSRKNPGLKMLLVLISIPSLAVRDE